MRCYRDVFGADEKTRTPSQDAVWKHLTSSSYKNKPIFVADRNGQMCPIRAAITEGRRSLFLEMELYVNFQQQIQKD